VRDFSIHGAKKSSPAPLFVMRTAVTAIIPEEGAVPSLYKVKNEREQLEHLNTVNKIGGLSKNVRFSHSTII
jgi:hypothetical protein